MSFLSSSRPTSETAYPAAVKASVEKALAASDRVYALSQGGVVLEAPTSEADLAERIERAYFGH